MDDDNDVGDNDGRRRKSRRSLGEAKGTRGRLGVAAAAALHGAGSEKRKWIEGKVGVGLGSSETR